MADRPDRSRAWGVLAVTLALMALVAALSSTTSRSPVDPAAASDTHPLHGGSKGVGTPGAPEPGQRSRPDGATGESDGSTASQTKGRGPSASFPEIADSAPGNRSGSGSSVGHAAPVLGMASDLGTAIAGTVTGADGAAGAGSESPSPSASQEPTAPSMASRPATSRAGVSSVAATDPGGAATPARPSTRSGVLGSTEAASFSALAGGPISADATWTGSTTLELSVSCPDGVSGVHTGASGLSVEVDDTHGNGTCTVTLAMPSGESGTVDYTVTVEPSA